MKGLFIAPANSIHSKKWIENFINKGFDIYWISFYKKSNNIGEIHKSIHFYEITSNNFVLVYLKVRRIFKTHFFSFVHLHYIGRMSYILLFLKFHKLIITPWGSDIKYVNENSLKGFIVSKLLNASYFLTVDANYMKHEIQRFTSNNLPVKLVNFGVDTELFKNKSKQNQTNTLKIISLRNLEEVYSVSTLVHSINILRLKNIELELIVDIYSDGQERNNILGLIEQLNLSKIISLKGRYDYKQLPLILNKYDVYISTSRSDAGLAASTAEAMASELFVITADNSDNSNWIKGKCGFLFKTDSADDLAVKIVDYNNLSNQEKNVYKKNARNKIIQNNSLKSEMKKMLQLYNNT